MGAALSILLAAGAVVIWDSHNDSDVLMIFCGLVVIVSSLALASFSDRGDA